MMRTISLTLLALSVSACAARGAYPSLAPRPIELQNGQANSPAPPAPTATDPARVARISAIVARAEGNGSAFSSARAEAERSVAASGARGSESWIAAQMAVSRLERTREATQEALAELDGEKRRILSGPASADQAALDAAIARVMAIETAQADAARSLLARIGR